ncbi:uncharacterized protein SPSK_02075 [Sporothrix schenckii 1099-18]|uniref:Uncharacterized protein n=1 Tax=Sporothrix schenckii 1099-18 TaxID=1397361 RepID=A0A0F2MG99_SPOSC|nr:uncharacterized protein SPSK_02075 [Sporothrix schenckii 1099-18]KJR87191.1 hypothetical protein SPSK_02075 [Sporothrix schenckii 1099-18]
MVGGGSDACSVRTTVQTFGCWQKKTPTTTAITKKYKQHPSAANGTARRRQQNDATRFPYSNGDDENMHSGIVNSISRTTDDCIWTGKSCSMSYQPL